jgi:hypothetical protein
MSSGPLRFVHAGDFHLERPLHGVEEIPGHLRDLFLVAPYRAAERVFSVALSEAADFLVLAGDVLDPDLTGPRGPLFLIEQFQRLAEREIAVYWAAGTVDAPERWPAELRLPANVHMFPSDRVQQIVHHRQGQPVARILGRSRSGRRSIEPAAFQPEGASLFCVAVAHGYAEAEALRARPIHYWALGGKHATGTLRSARQVAHFPGTHQGRHPGEPGPRTVSLVEVGPGGPTALRPLSCDVLRWHDLRVSLGFDTTSDDLLTQLRGALREAAVAGRQRDLIVSLKVSGDGPVAAQLRRGPLAQQFLETLRAEFGYASPTVWPASLELEPPVHWPPDLTEQETLLGDFLRELLRRQEEDSALDLSGYAHGIPDGLPQGATWLEDASHRGRVLREGALLGVELLRGEAQS